MDFPLRHCYTLKHIDRFLLHPIRQLAAENQFLNLFKITVMFVIMTVRVLMFVTVVMIMMLVFMSVRMFVIVVLMLTLMRVTVNMGMCMRYTFRMGMFMFVTMLMRVGVPMIMVQMNIELHPVDVRLLSARDMQMIPIQSQLLQFML